MKIISGVPYGENSRIDGVISHADVDKDGVISKDEFLRFARGTSQVTYPAFTIRMTMIESIGGKSYWDKMAKSREKNFGELKVSQILKG